MSLMESQGRGQGAGSQLVAEKGCSKFGFAEVFVPLKLYRLRQR